MKEKAKKPFVLQSEGRFYGEFVDRSEHDTYDEAEEAAIALFNNGKGDPGDFRIVEVATDNWWSIRGYRLMTEKCPVCGKDVCRQYMMLTHDCHGIPYRYVCDQCYDKIMSTKGYDGERYNLDPYDY